MKTPDIKTADYFTIIGFTPLTRSGEAWLAENLPDETPALGPTRWVEARFARDVADGAVSDGLAVA